MDESVEGVLAVIDALEKLAITYYVGGSLASSSYGAYRATADADLVADIYPAHVEDLVNALSPEFYIDAEMIKDAIQRRSSFNLLGYKIFAKIDIFIPKDRPYSRAAFERRVLRQIDPDSGREVYVASPEDTVLAKLEWYRLGHEVSERQWKDVRGVLSEQQKTLDLAYLRRWAAEIGVADLLSRALDESGVVG